jgi:hypothetical protein
MGMLAIAMLLDHHVLWRLCRLETKHAPGMVKIKMIMAWCSGFVSSQYHD